MLTKCPHCGFVEDVPAEYAGEVGECASCHREYRVARQGTSTHSKLALSRPSQQVCGWLPPDIASVYDASPAFRKIYDLFLVDLEKIRACKGNFRVTEIDYLNPRKGEIVLLRFDDVTLEESISASNSSTKEVGCGTLYVTNSRFLFVYGAKVREILYTAMSTFRCRWRPSYGSVSIGVGTRARTQVLLVPDVFMLGLGYQMATDARFLSVVQTFGVAQDDSPEWDAAARVLYAKVKKCLEDAVDGEKYDRQLAKERQREAAIAAQYAMQEKEAEQSVAAWRIGCITVIVVIILIFIFTS